MTRALLLLALLSGGCMVDAAIDTEVEAPALSFPQGGAWSGELVSQSRTVPISLAAPVLHQVSAVRINSVVLRPSRACTRSTSSAASRWWRTAATGSPTSR